MKTRRKSAAPVIESVIAGPPNVASPSDITAAPHPTRARLNLDNLADHPENSNVMDQATFNKLLGHLRASGYYPPLIVRPLPAAVSYSPDAMDSTNTVNTTKSANSSNATGETPNSPRYQILDGHHRARALRLLNHAQADCEIWPIDDAQALLYLATLNRLRGRDDLKRRAALIASLRTRTAMDGAALAKLIPESRRDLERLATLLERPRPRPRTMSESVPVPVHFFLTRDQRDRLEACLRRQGPPRDLALMKLLDMAGA